MADENEYVELTGDDLPYHLRDDAPPLARCRRCGRQTWDAAAAGTEDRMPQPDGDPCGGLFVGALEDQQETPNA